MQQVLDHERLDVYGLALDFVVFANGVIEGLLEGEAIWPISSCVRRCLWC